MRNLIILTYTHISHNIDHQELTFFQALLYLCDILFRFHDGGVGVPSFRGELWQFILF